MFVEFLYELRARKVPVGTQEAVNLAQALTAGLHDSSLEGFYHVARALLVHSEAHLDDFDLVFAHHFRGVAIEAKALADELLGWLADAKQRRVLSPEELAAIERLDLDEVRRRFEERLREQKERHDGGSYWIGTGGTSPFGRGGTHPDGIRVGPAGGGSGGAMKSADARRYKPYRSDLRLDLRQMQIALRKLRAFGREGGAPELDVDATIDETAKNAGELSVVLRPPRRPSTRVILMMDVGGSMDPFASLVSHLFSAAKSSTHWKDLRTYYFHNCVYGKVYKTERFDEPVRVDDLLRECGKHYKLVMLGDAYMAPYELFGSYAERSDERLTGLGWLLRLREHFTRSVWLNPESPRGWAGSTIEQIGRVFPMYELTLDGLGQAVSELVRGAARR
jgi:uncharacterized protein with von Willebrand factor type A (vWA) domain